MKIEETDDNIKIIISTEEALKLFNDPELFKIAHKKIVNTLSVLLYDYKIITEKEYDILMSGGEIKRNGNILTIDQGDGKIVTFQSVMIKTPTSDIILLDLNNAQEYVMDDNGKCIDEINHYDTFDIKTYLT